MVPSYYIIDIERFIMAIKKEEKLIGDSGVIKKNDPIGLCSTIVCNILIVVLVILSVLAFM